MRNLRLECMVCTLLSCFVVGLDTKAHFFVLTSPSLSSCVLCAAPAAACACACVTATSAAPSARRATTRSSSRVPQPTAPSLRSARSGRCQRSCRTPRLRVQRGREPPQQQLPRPSPLPPWRRRHSEAPMPRRRKPMGMLQGQQRPRPPRLLTPPGWCCGANRCGRPACLWCKRRRGLIPVARRRRRRCRTACCA